MVILPMVIIAEANIRLSWLLRYIKNWVKSINVTRRMRGNNYIVYGES